MGGLSPSHDLDPSLEDAPPPPPPPHRVSVNEAGYLSRPGSSSHLSSRSGGSQQRDPRALTPDDGRTSAEYGNTPSPLRDAMEDVMSSLQDMGRPRGATSPGGDPVYTPWPAEDLEQSGVTSAPRSTGRPSTQDSWSAPQDTSFERYQEGPPQFSNYVQRMESRLRQLHAQNARKGSDELHFARSSEDQDVLPPLPSIGNSSRHQSPAIEDANARMGKRRSGFNTVGRSSTNRSSATNSSSGVQSTMTNLTNSTNSTGLTGQSVMSGYSASGFSATSAGSFARRGKIGGGSFNRSRPNTSMENHTPASTRPQSPATGPSYHSSHNTSRQGATSALGHSDYSQPSPAVTESERPVSPNKKKSGFFRKMIESARSAKSSAANSRSVKATSGAASPSKSSRLGSALSHSRLKSHSSSKDIGQGPADWVQVRRDVNRAITPSKLELMEKAERCQMMDFPVIYAIEDLYESAEGDEGIDGLPIEEPTDWANMNLAMVDKNT
ncbi:cytokinesis protein 3, partial [Ascosphaera atra]